MRINRIGTTLQLSSSFYFKEDKLFRFYWSSQLDTEA